MKYRITRKEVRRVYSRIYAVSDDVIQYLFAYHRPVMYIAGVYGWDCDVYDFGDIAVCAGYRPMGVRIPREEIEPLNLHAQDILMNGAKLDDEKRNEIDNIIQQLFDNR